ncbi:MAG: A24 family peptidase [Planctomycetota bacterium]
MSSSATNLRASLDPGVTHRHRQRDLPTTTDLQITLTGRKVALTIAVLLLLVYSQVLLQNISNALLVLLLAAACHHDWSKLKIPNSLTYPAVVAGLGLNLFATALVAFSGRTTPEWLGTVGLANSLLGLFVGFSVMAIVFAIARKGAGDVKLAAAMGTLVGAADMFAILIWSQLLAAVFVALWAIVAIGPINICLQMPRTVGNLIRPDKVRPAKSQLQELLARPVPMAGFFALATLICRGGF